MGSFGASEVEACCPLFYFSLFLPAFRWLGTLNSDVYRDSLLQTTDALHPMLHTVATGNCVYKMRWI